MDNNTGIPYEKLTQYIFNEIVNQDFVENIKVEHNITLEGKSTKHQIDVYWEFMVGGVKYSTVVQAKDWSQPVDQGELLKFKEVLDDLPDQPRGIFVTRTGYQEGAKKVAKAHGILLYEFRVPTEKDWEGRVRTVVLNIVVYFPFRQDVHLEIDNRWVETERKKLELSNDDKIDIRLESMSDEMVLYDEEEKPIGTIYDYLNKLYPKRNEEIPPTRKSYSFDNPTFLLTGNDRFPKIKINGLSATISVSMEERETRLEFEDVVGFILKNVLDEAETIKIFDKNKKYIKNTKFP